MQDPGDPQDQRAGDESQAASPAKARRKARSNASLNNLDAREHDASSSGALGTIIAAGEAADASHVRGSGTRRRKSRDSENALSHASTGDLAPHGERRDRESSSKSRSLSSMRIDAGSRSDLLGPPNPALPPLPVPPATPPPAVSAEYSQSSLSARRARRLSRQTTSSQLQVNQPISIPATAPAPLALPSSPPMPPDISPLERARLRVQQRRASAAARDGTAGVTEGSDVLGYGAREATHTPPPPRSPSPSVRPPPRAPTPLAERLYASTHELQNRSALALPPGVSPSARPSITPPAMPFGTRRKRGRAAAAAVLGSTQMLGPEAQQLETSADSVVQVPEPARSTDDKDDVGLVALECLTLLAPIAPMDLAKILASPRPEVTFIPAPSIHPNSTSNGTTLSELVRPLSPRTHVPPTADHAAWSSEREGEGLFIGEILRVREENITRTTARLAVSGWSPAPPFPAPSPLLPVPLRPLSLAEASRPPPQHLGTHPHLAFIHHPFRSSSIGQTQPLVLVLDIQHLQWRDHPLMSAEDLAVRRLQAAYEELREHKRSSAATWLTGRIETLRSSLSDAGAGPGADGRSALKILADISLARSALHAERARYRDLVHGTLRAWEEVKRVREAQGFTCTNLIVAVRAGPELGEWDRVDYFRELEEEVEERRMRSDLTRDAKLQRHERKSAQWAASQEALASASVNSLVSSSELQLAGKGLKPPRLEAFDETATREEVRGVLDKGGVGAREIEVRVSEGHLVTPTGVVPKTEQSRRRRIVQDRRVQLRVLCNGKYVATSPERTVNPTTFGADFYGVSPVPRGLNYLGSSKSRRTIGPASVGGSTAPEPDPDDLSTQSEPRSDGKTGWMIVMKLEDVPMSLVIEVLEAGNVVGVVDVATPEPNETVSNMDSDGRKCAFSGIKIRENAEDGKVDRRLSGEVTLKAMWGVGPNGEALGPGGGRQNLFGDWDLGSIGGSQLSGALRGRLGIYNIRKLVEWTSRLRLDPNNPMTSDLVRLRDLVMASRPRDGTLDSPADLASAVEYWVKRRFFRFAIPSRLHRLILGVGEEWMAAKRAELCRLRWKNKVVVKGPLPGWDDAITAEVWEKIKIEVDEEKEALDSYQQNLAHRDQNSLSHLSTSVLELATSRSHLEASVPAPPSPISQVSLLKRVRAHQIFRQARMNRPSLVSDFVREEYLPPAEPLTISLAKYVRIRRPLKPERIERAKIATPETPTKCELVVQVIRGFNVPVRKDATAIKSAPAASGASSAVWTGSNEAQSTLVRPYVEVHFQRRRVRTVAADGPNPQWNETLSLPFAPFRNEFFQENLLETDALLEMIYINLFDEVMVDLVVDDRDKDKVIHQRREKNWLGSVAVPFSFVYEQLRVDGVFPVKLPIVLLNYEKNRSTARENEITIGVDGSMDTLLHLFITLEPPLARPDPLSLRFKSDEAQRVLEMCETWKRTVNQRIGALPEDKGKGRRVEAIALDTSGRTVLLPRYIHPQHPPPELETISKLVRFVSLIPTVPSDISFMSRTDILCTSKEFLDVGVGDRTEHAILLCNFLLAWGRDAYIVVGEAVPEGRTAWVLVLDDRRDQRGSLAPTAATARKASTVDGVGVSARSGARLYNPVSGAVVETWEAHGTLRRVSYAFNNTNVWANIQTYDDAPRMSWTLSDPACWCKMVQEENAKAWYGGEDGNRFWWAGLPAWSGKAEFRTIQASALTYMPAHPSFPRDLELLLHRTLTAKLESWRTPRHTTRWNRLISRAASTHLAKLELDHTAGTTSGAASLRGEIAGWAASGYTVRGLVVHQAWSDIKSVVDAVWNTGVGEADDEGVEFALSVHAAGYPGGVVSVWVFVANFIQMYFIVLRRGKGNKTLPRTSTRRREREDDYDVRSFLCATDLLTECREEGEIRYRWCCNSYKIFGFSHFKASANTLIIVMNLYWVPRISLGE
ncbi:hypothetical protein M427DRAFT_498440 [Gonapodya prolifera JEL478]|uniref:C2 domain-containing protein n=1 Tax=Gonapodya prolifera (strain JEL478) TaxID=1344416 RepID=A0A139ACP5_GONPJ|nr:hypothetical protein M427DRAFT_498440 [Gonapodya prolifera JEL478]|eukprot:KXS14582.1 hypothetical protein M427DRAFT_498440 [Gonapodya prolifera JEL478]